MVLTQIDQEIFWELWLKILVFVNDEYNLLPDFGHPRFPREILGQSEKIMVLRDKIWSDNTIIDRFVKARPGLGRLRTNILYGWKNRVKGAFVIARDFDDYTVFMDDENKCLWGVVGVSAEIRDVVKNSLPCMINAVLLPFKNRITYDTMLFDANVRVTGDMWQDIEDHYQAYKKDGLRVGFGDRPGEYLLAELPEDRTPPPKPTRGKTADDVWEGIGAKIRRVLDENPDATLAEISEKMNTIAEAGSSKGLARFDGLSPDQIHRMTYKPLGENGVVIKHGVGSDAPLVKQARYLLDVIARGGRLKLTAAGNLPVAIVEEIVAQKFVPRFRVEAFRPRKHTRESDVHSLELTRILCYLSGLVEKRGGALELTQKGKKHLAANDVFAPLFQAYCEEFNWGYFDFYTDESFDDVGRLCYPFSFYLLAKYGGETRGVDFYTEKYRLAFFDDLTEEDDMRTVRRAYAWRTFDQFLDYFGLLDPAGRSPLGVMSTVLVTPLFSECLDIDVTGGR